MAQKTVRALTAKQRKFAILFASGETATAAYMQAYGTKNEKIASSSGAKLRKDARILQEISKLSQENDARLQETLQKEDKELIMNRAQRQKFWTEIALDPFQPINARLKATELLGRSEADFTENVNFKEAPVIKMDVSEES